MLVAVLIFFAVYGGIRDVDRRLIERVQTLGGGRWVLLREVYLPSVTAWIMGNMKVAVGFAFTGAVVGEFVASSRGLGYLLSFAQSTYNAALVLGLVLLIMLFVLVLFVLAGRLERRLLRWRYAGTRGEDDMAEGDIAALGAELVRLLHLGREADRHRVPCRGGDAGGAAGGKAAAGADRGRAHRCGARVLRVLGAGGGAGLLHRRGRPRQLQRRALYPRLQGAWRGGEERRRGGAGGRGLGRRGGFPGDPAGEGEAGLDRLWAARDTCRWRRT